MACESSSNFCPDDKPGTALSASSGTGPRPGFCLTAMVFPLLSPVN